MSFLANPLAHFYDNCSVNSLASTFHLHGPLPAAPGPPPPVDHVDPDGTRGDWRLFSNWLLANLDLLFLTVELCQCCCLARFFLLSVWSEWDTVSGSYMFYDENSDLND